MDDNNWIVFSTPNGDSRFFYDHFMKSLEKGQVFIGIDWAKDSGMSRGDVIGREGNVVHVRFKTVGVRRGK